MNSSFYKIKRYGVVSGVCAGIADKYGWDIVVVRVVTFLLCWCWGTGIVVYFVLAIILPEKDLTNTHTHDSDTFNAEYDVKEDSEV